MALDPDTVDIMRMLLGDDATPYTFSDDQLEIAVNMHDGLWCQAAAFLARRKGADLASSHVMSKSMGGTSISTGDPSRSWSDMASNIERFCTNYVGSPSELSYGPNDAGATDDPYRRQMFDLWMSANPAATENEPYDPAHLNPSF